MKTLLLVAALALLAAACAQSDGKRFPLSDEDERGAAKLCDSQGYRLYRLSEIRDSVTCYQFAHEGATRVEAAP